MPLWSVKSVNEEPIIEISQWQIFEIHLKNGEYRLIFGTTSDGAGRRSTNIANWDHGSNVATTESGRRYLLLGPPGMSANARFVFDSSIPDSSLRAVDVSKEYYNE